MSLDLSDRRLAELIHDVAEQAARAVVEQGSVRVLYGTVVGAPDPVARTVAVALRGGHEPSPGIVYDEHAPVAGDTVRIVLLPTGDRYVDAIVGRPLERAGSSLVADAGLIAHGLGRVPTRYGVTPTVANRIVAVTAADEVNLTVALRTDAGVAVGAAELVAWWVAG